LTKEGRPSYSQGSFERATAELLKSQKKWFEEVRLGRKNINVIFFYLEDQVVMQLKKKNLNLTVHRKFIQPAVKIGKTRRKKKQTKSLNFLWYFPQTSKSSQQGQSIYVKRCNLAECSVKLVHFPFKIQFSKL